MSATAGVDLSEKMIEQARKAAEGVRNVEFLQANAEELPFEEAPFDRVVSTMSFHHWPRPSRAMGEIARVLEPAGAVCIADPTADTSSCGGRTPMFGAAIQVT
jgi:ubiquinone/menaquinone biosynthesis C-methylase UbiE